MCTEYACHRDIQKGFKKIWNIFSFCQHCHFSGLICDHVIKDCIKMHMHKGAELRLCRQI